MIPVMKDADIRAVLHATDVKRLCLEDPSSRVIDELGLLEGKFRMDVAVVNGQLHGYEIKSALDTLVRLPNQQETYNQIFDRITLVADEKHVQEAMKIVPPWWGLMTASWRDGKPTLNEIWPARQNFAIDPYALCQLLWRDEAIALLRRTGQLRKFRPRRRRQMWKLLADYMDINDLRAAVRHALKVRTNWRDS